MQLDTITELLDIPNYNVTHVIQNDGSSLHFIVDQIEPLPPAANVTVYWLRAKLAATETFAVTFASVRGLAAK